jgi:hypothetical protein
MKRIFWLNLLLAFLLVHPIFTVEVDRSELTSNLDETIRFQNYEGPIGKFETAEQIRSIGTYLVDQIGREDDGRLKAGTATYFDKYRLTHIPPVFGDPGRGADILEILPDAQVDHIDNLRRILSAYLEVAYGYSSTDAYTLGIFTTLYNAVHRGAFERFQSRYRGAVVSLLEPEKTGIALSYTQWPGGTQLVIPLAVDTPPGQLSAVPADELASPEVVETLRDQEDRGIEERQQVTDLIDRSVEQERDQIQAQRETARQQDQQSAEGTEQQPGPSQQDPESSPASDPAPEDQQVSTSSSEDVQSAREDSQVTTQQSEEASPSTADQGSENDTVEAPQTPSEQPQEAVEQSSRPSEEQLAQREEELQQAQERSDEIREETARDIQETQQPAVTLSPKPVIFADTNLQDGMIISRFQRIDANSGDIITPGPESSFIGRKLLDIPQGLLGVVFEDDVAHLSLVAKDSFQISTISEEQLSPYSDVLFDRNLGRIFAVVLNEGDWYIGQFDPGLQLTSISVLAVRQETSLVIEGDVLLVSRKDGKIARLAITDLKISAGQGEQ